MRSTVTLANQGTAALTLGSLTVTGQGFSFAAPIAMPVTIAPGSSQVIPVVFTPAIPGDFAGQLMAMDRSNQPLASASITGHGIMSLAPLLTVSTSSLNFGTLALNSTAKQSVTLTSSGTAPITVSSIDLSGSAFSLTGATAPATLSPGQTLTLQVSFDPTQAGAASGTITISSNSTGGSTNIVSLSGTGTSPANPILTLSTTSLSFGNDPLSSPITLSVTLTSTGTSPVTVSAAGLTGVGFSYSGATFPVTLNPTIAIKVQVQFDPTVAGAASGTLTFTSNSSTGTTSVVSLSGTGVATQHQVSLNWNAPVNSPVPVTGYKIYRATGTSTSFQVLSSSTGTAYIDLAVTASSTYTYYVTSVDSAGTESVPSSQVAVTVP